jgi:hypothetical protein
LDGAALSDMDFEQSVPNDGLVQSSGRRMGKGVHPRWTPGDGARRRAWMEEKAGCLIPGMF